MLHNGSRQKTFFLMSFKGTGKLYFIFIRMSSLFRLRKPAFSTYSFGKLASCLSLFAISCLFHVLNLMPSQDFETLDSSFRCYFLLCSSSIKTICKNIRIVFWETRHLRGFEFLKKVLFQFYSLTKFHL